MLHDFLSLPSILLAICAALVAVAIYTLGIAAGKLHREWDRRTTARQVLDIQNSIARHDDMMAQAELDYAARMGLTQGDCNA